MFCKYLTSIRLKLILITATTSLLFFYIGFLSKNFLENYILIGIMTLFSISLLIYYTYKFTKPIITLVTFFKKDMKKALIGRIECNLNDEYGILFSEINSLIHKINQYSESEKIFEATFNTQSGMTITDKNQKILRINKKFTEITGYQESEIIGKNPSILKSGYQDIDFYEKMYESLRENFFWKGEIVNKNKYGKVFSEYLTIQTVLDDNNEVAFYIASFIDLTDKKESEEEIKKLNKHDSLTGLGNRNLLLKEIELSITDNKSIFSSVVMINIKDFKLINDAYGYYVGDLLLIDIVERLQSDCSNLSFISRTGSNEFALLFEYEELSKEDVYPQLDINIEQIISSITKKVTIEDNLIQTDLNLGCFFYQKNDQSPDEILKNTSMALNLSKEKDLQVFYFNEEDESRAKSHINIYQKLLLALEKEEFNLNYQLQFDYEGNPYGAEALIRWEHPDGMIYPDQFIPLAEKTGIIVALGDWILKTACLQLVEWSKKEKTKDFFIAVNISAKQFKQSDFVEKTIKIIKDTNVDASKLKFELTESILVDNIEKVILKFNKLKNLGIKISLDDFGTGYSSLQYLKRLPLDQVKIDQSFVFNMLSNKNDIAIIESVILLSKSFKFDIIAEGVETKAHYEVLKKLGCKYFQGYYFSKPYNIKEVNKIIYKKYSQ